MKVEFIVQGRPPKKHGEKSMWARDDEAPQVFLLRQKALEARLKADLEDCFRSPVALKLTIFTPRSRLESVGDLDNFITGVCDALQAADSKVIPHLHKTFKKVENGEMDPRKPLLIDNDAKVVSIVANKVVIGDEQDLHYKVAVEPAH